MDWLRHSMHGKCAFSSLHNIPNVKCIYAPVQMAITCYHDEMGQMLHL